MSNLLGLQSPCQTQEQLPILRAIIHSIFTADLCE